MTNFSTQKDAKNQRRRAIAAVRVSPHGYFGALLVLTFFSALLMYLDAYMAGLLILAVSWLAISALALTDRIVFDGRRLRRTGVIPAIWNRSCGLRDRLKLSDIELVETRSLRALKRGGNIRYRYNTIVRGKGTTFAFASGRGYRQMILELFPHLAENVLDARSIELRDYLAETRDVLTKARESHIPPAEVLENSIRKPRKGRSRSNPPTEMEVPKGSANAEGLRLLANGLRLSGFLLPALEAFRRALLLRPRDGWLWLEYGRCMQSLAGSEKDERLGRRSIAMMRLAERHAEQNSELLARLGESYCQAGEWGSASRAFRKSIQVTGENFRATRGLAELALRDGKIAHVIHNFAGAARAVETAALRRWSRGEEEYFSRLNDDEDYMEMEFRRLALADKLYSVRGSALRIALISLPWIAIGILMEQEAIANVGWTVSTAAILVWVAVSIARRTLADRIPPDMIDADD